MYDGVPFSGRLVKLRLKSNASSYGPIPEPDAEVEQKLEVSVKKKTARLSCYNFGNGAKYLLNQVYVRRESEKDIRDILAMFEAVFSAYEPTGFVCDAGSWELVLTNDKRERFHYEGTLCTDFNWQGKSVSDRLRSILDWPDLWAFAPALEEEADAGSETFTCNVCQAIKTEDIAKVHEHDYTRLGEIIEGPYCVTEGKRWMYCSYEGCNERVLMPVPAIGYHDWDTEHAECLKKATCTEKGTMLMHCKRDASHTMTYDYGGTGHIWDEGVITTPPTYEEYGEKTLRCKNCDATKTEKVLPTKYTFTVTVVQPTCTEDGYTMHKCNQDDSLSYKDNIVHSTGHHAAKRVIEPTCKEEGRTEIYCIVCGDVSSTFDFTPKKDHTWDNGVVTTEPTAEKEGVKTYTCTVCQETKTEPIPRLNSSGK